MATLTKSVQAKRRTPRRHHAVAVAFINAVSSPISGVKNLLVFCRHFLDNVRAEKFNKGCSFSKANFYVSSSKNLQNLPLQAQGNVFGYFFRSKKVS
ncbi:hypothetical protein Dip510_000477 [Elusimicrobium posterum]|uniref:hypothetical protein n=1 Tax=Elusimicrobium posterum TaxID=3116653 RepID=UPI003C749238